MSGICCVDDVVCVSMHRSPQLFLLHAHSTQLLQEIDITPMCSLIGKISGSGTLLKSSDLPG